MRIEVYILCNKNPGIQNMAMAKWVVVAFDENKRIIWQRDGIVGLPKSTNKKASLIALRDALKRFTKPAVINLYIQNPFVKNMMQTNMPHRWSIHRWRKYRYNGPIKYCEYWQEIYTLLKNHAIKYAYRHELYGIDITKRLEVK